MLLRNRLKKELANLLILKNRIYFGSILFILIITGLITISNEYMKMPKDDWSLGISNYQSVEEYPYAVFPRDKKNFLLKDLSYSFCENLNIPGMPQSRELDYEHKYIFSTNQCLQGLCITDQYVLITSDSVESGCYGELFIFDKETGEYLVTLAMDEDSHLGGIAWDGTNIWICNSSNNTIERIPYAFIERVATKEYGTVILALNLMETYKVLNSPSGIAYENGYLWIVSHNIWGNANMIAYQYDSQINTLFVIDQYVIPSQVQGIVFDEKGSVYLSISYGRRRSSYIRKYTSLTQLDSNLEDYEWSIEMPPCSEGIEVIDAKLYVLFESAGEKYLHGTDGLGVSICPIDKVLIIDLTLS